MAQNIQKAAAYFGSSGRPRSKTRANPPADTRANPPDNTRAYPSDDTRANPSDNTCVYPSDDTRAYPSDEILLLLFPSSAIIIWKNRNPGLAKFGIALGLGPRDRGFKSRNPDQTEGGAKRLLLFGIRIWLRDLNRAAARRRALRTAKKRHSLPRAPFLRP